MNVLVTGGAGFIGSHVLDLLVEHGAAITVLDNLDPQVHNGRSDPPPYVGDLVRKGAVRFQHGDVTDPAAVGAALDGVDTVIHLAAAVGVGQSMYQPRHYTHTNSCGTAVLLECLLARDEVRKLVVASSMSLYGEGAYRCPSCAGTEPAPRTDERLRRGQWETPCAACGADLESLPTSESKPAAIASVYAATKKHQEDLAIAFGRARSLPTFALRFFNTYGPRQSLANPYTGVVAIFLSRLLNARPPLVFEDGLQSRDFIDVRDIARAVVLAAESPETGAHVLNVGTGHPTPVVEVAHELNRRLGLDIAPQLLKEFRAGDIRHCIADTSKARAVLGFEAVHTLADGLEPLVEWCRGQRPQDKADESYRELQTWRLLR